ncbi:L-rhamnose mutarotase [Sphingomonas sp. AR_OL41]|uniref:L-rhamnose mutarotase n=1 Tax=Sphingomonas sp. AR_OL41 TaxID=3042729 RepID=UPI00247FC935|nr:L-rhamnose mutarotase [Sphingomonas sp. AR_OL41]MDH7973917.1 L-rhamnose mutarotase [Sphingomonas sp. AR_OL41]
MTRRLCFALDLVEDADLIARYEAHHAPGAVWPEVLADIRDSGVVDMEIWRTGTRMFMIATVAADYPRDRAPAARDVEWQQLMWTFQRPLPHAAPGEKWTEMKRIFSLSEEGRE